MKTIARNRILPWVSILLLAAGFWLGLQDRITSGGLLFAVGCFFLTLSLHAPGPYLRGRW